MAAHVRSSTRLILLGAALLGAVLWLLALDRGTLEHGNRLFRRGEPTAAAEVYERLARTSTTAAYNLGTTRLLLDSDSAEAPLLRGTESSDVGVQQRAHYNLAYALQARVNGGIPADSTLLLLREAVRHGRHALRLDPADESARWNLALAQRMLDSISVNMLDPKGRTSAGDDETPIDLEALTRSGEGTGESGLEPENPDAGQSTGLRYGASQGAREAWATQDPGPLSPEEARRLLATVVDQPERLIRGILWSGRPHVEWWTSQGYPGGDW